MIRAKKQFKNCPFCDGEKVRLFYDTVEKATVQCTTCGATGPRTPDYQTAMAGWNFRCLA